MSMITVDTRDRKPIYEQLCDNIRRLVLQGVLKPGEQLPGVRTLAVQLAINPNTIQKAYSELERQGIIYSVTGRGSFVLEDVSSLLSKQRQDSLNEIERSMAAAHSIGVKKEEVLKIAAKIWEVSE